MRHIDLLNAALVERRRNPELSRKQSAVEALQRFAGKAVFVTFTHDVGSKSHNVKPAHGRHGQTSAIHHTRGAKIGINPQSEYATPTGIYAYPIDYVLSKAGRVEFGGDRPFLWVFEAAGKVLDLATYSKADLADDAARLGQKPDGTAAREAFVQTPGGKLWNIVRKLALRDARQKLEATAEDTADARQAAAFEEWMERWSANREGEEGVDDEAEEEAADEFYEQYEDDYHVDEASVASAAPPAWNRRFRTLGYVGVVDSAGEGIIHKNEPKQAVFFSKAGLRVLALIDNLTPQEPRTDMEIWSKQPRALIALLRKGRFSDAELIDMVDAYPHIVFTVGVAHFPPAVQTYIRDDIGRFANDSFGTFKPEEFGLNDEQTIKLLAHEPGWAATYGVLSPAMKRYIFANLRSFYPYLDRLALSDAEKLHVLQASPEAYHFIEKSRPSLFLQKYMVVHHPEDIRNSMYRMNFAPETYVAYFVSQILRGPEKKSRDSFLCALLGQHNGEGYPTFLACFAKLPAPQALTFVKRIYGDGRYLTYELADAMVKLKPGIAVVDPFRFQAMMTTA